MDNSNLPFISVVTPVYNGEEYLDECINSVLEQTYTHWEYVILDNCSTDNTLQIAQKYASKDDRIKVYSNEDFLKQIPNWNKVIQLISDDSKYCKTVQADDWIFPDCIEKMVARAEENPTAGIVSAYRLLGNKVGGVRGKGLPYDITFMSGKEAGRKVITTPLFLFGSPSSILYRADLIREKDGFYDASVVHSDTDACFNILRKSDFAFVHQILSFTRLHEASTTAFCDYYDTYSLFDIYTVKKYGSYYLGPDEYDEVLADTIKKHHQKLVKLIIDDRGKDVWEYHKKELAKMGVTMNRSKIAKLFLIEMMKIKPALKWILKKFDYFKYTQSSKEIIEEKKEGTVIIDTE